jgi:hypothetical protein
VIFGARRLARRRAALVERSAALRASIAAASAPLVAKADAAERLVAAVRASLPWITRAVTVYSLLKQRK